MLALLVAVCAALAGAVPATTPPAPLSEFEAREAPTVAKLLSLKGRRKRAVFIFSEALSEFRKPQINTYPASAARPKTCVPFP